MNVFQIPDFHRFGQAKGLRTFRIAKSAWIMYAGIPFG